MSNVRWRAKLGLPPQQKLDGYEEKTVRMVRSLIPELTSISADDIIKLWEDFSDSRCAQFLHCYDKSVEEFWEWCNDETD